MKNVEIGLLTLGANEIDTAIAAATARINAVAPSKTLIDSISDVEWLADGVAEWNIEAGACFDTEDELDCIDGDLAGHQVA